MLQKNIQNSFCVVDFFIIICLFTFLLPILFYSGSKEFIPAGTAREAGYALDRSPPYGPRQKNTALHAHTQGQWKVAREPGKKQHKHRENAAFTYTSKITL